MAANPDNVRDVTLRNILPLLLFRNWWNHYMRTIFLDSRPCLVTDLLKKRCVGPYLQKSFLWEEKGLSFRTYSGTHLLTRSLNSEAARLRHEGSLEKLYLLRSSSIPLQNRGYIHTANGFKVKAHFCPLCAGDRGWWRCVTGAGVPPGRADGGVQRGQQQARRSSLGSPLHLLSWCWRLVGKAGGSDRWWPLCSLLSVPGPRCGAFVSQHD